MKGWERRRVLLMRMIRGLGFILGRRITGPEAKAKAIIR